MNRILSIALLIAGVILTAWGVRASQAFSSDVSRILTGEPTDKAIWLLVGGIALTAAGLFGSLRGGRDG
jgi:hypothetical protein